MADAPASPPALPVPVAPPDGAARADRYARAVAAGEIPAGKWARLACERHLADLARAEADEAFPYCYDAAQAARVCRFIGKLPHVKGEWARVPPDGKIPRIALEDWQCFFIASIFGWIKRADGTRRFRSASLYVPRKNGKSIIAAAIGWWMFACDGEPGAEVYSGATSRAQAMEVFKPAQQMARKIPALAEQNGVEVNASNMVRLTDNCKFEPVIGKPGDGASPHCALVDEYHEHPTSDLVDTMLTGMGARRQPLLLIISTAGSNLAGPCRDDWKACEDTLLAASAKDYARVDETRFAVIYSADPEDDWTAEATLRKANPNFGVSVGADFLREQIRLAIAQPRNQGAVKTKHLNLWVTAMSGFFDVQKLGLPPVSAPQLRLDDFAGKPCYIGVDAAAKRDICAVVRVFPAADGKSFAAFGRYYLPRAAVALPQSQNYRAWETAGWLAVCDGNVNDFDLLESDVVADAKRFDVREVDFDPWQMQPVVGRWRATHGLTCVEIPRTTKSFSDTMKTLDALIADGRFHHAGDPVLVWALGNVVAREDPGGNVFPRKEQDGQKIDPAVALLMALHRALANAGEEAPAAGFSFV